VGAEGSGVGDLCLGVDGWIGSCFGVGDDWLREKDAVDLMRRTVDVLHS
jgi:hypothetical protein